MGKGDKKSKKGKIFMGSYGIKRPRKASKGIKPVVKAKAEAPAAAEAKPVKKAAAKKPAKKAAKKAE